MKWSGYWRWCSGVNGFTGMVELLRPTWSQRPGPVRPGYYDPTSRAIEKPRRLNEDDFSKQENKNQNKKVGWWWWWVDVQSFFFLQGLLLLRSDGLYSPCLFSLLSLRGWKILIVCFLQFDLFRYQWARWLSIEKGSKTISRLVIIRRKEIMVWFFFILHVNKTIKTYKTYIYKNI